ncbi:hypothetical protein ACFX19_022680 [Malus domestica]
MLTLSVSLHSYFSGAAPPFPPAAKQLFSSSSLTFPSLFISAPAKPTSLASLRAAQRQLPSPAPPLSSLSQVSSAAKGQPLPFSLLPCLRAAQRAAPLSTPLQDPNYPL